MFEIEKINKILNGKIHGNRDLIIKGPCGIQNGKANHISYIKNQKYVKFIKDTDASVIIVDSSIDFSNIPNKTLLVVKNASLSFIEFLKYYESKKNINYTKTSYGNSFIHSSSKIGENVHLGNNVFIGENVEIKENVFIDNNTVIHNNTKIEKNSAIHANVVIYRFTKIGENCKIKSGSVIGGTGFGLITDKDGMHHRIPHVGNVKIGNNVMIGSNCTIDRGTIDDTIILDGTNIDNMVHIAHNVNIGKNCIMCAQVAIAGSTKIKDNVVIGGQTGIVDNLIIADNVIVGPRSFVVKSIKSNSYVSGNPARNHSDHIKQDILISKLPEIYKKISNYE